MKRPEEYTAGKILKLIEGSLAPVACMEGDVNDCPRQGMCATLRLWEKINAAVEDVVEHVTLADLVSWQQELAGKKE